MEPLKLEDLRNKKQPFELPDGYFEDLPLKIQTRIEARKTNNWSLSIHPSLKLAVSSAAILTIVFAIIFFNTDIPETSQDLIASIPQEDLIAYVAQMQLDEYDLLTAFEDSFDDYGIINDGMLEDLNLQYELMDEVMEVYELSEEYL